MAVITSFTKITTDRTRVHRTQVECGYAVIDAAGRRYLQLETYGSDERKIPGKVSQTLQLDMPAAAKLKKILSSAFPELDDKP